MTDEIDLVTNNLCITEDAFEQFQAVSMYEEDEYITLSDIIPPEPVAPDLPNDMNEIPYDNEVVLSSNLDEQICEVNSTSELGIEQKNNGTELPHVSLPQNYKSAQENIDDTAGPKTESSATKPKRGRKKKISVVNNEDATASSTVSQENNVCQIGNESLDSAMATTRVRRGRNAKKNQQGTINQNDITHSPVETNNFDKPPKRQKKIARKLASNLEQEIITKKRPGRRGRKAKVPLEENTTNKIDHEENGENKLSRESNFYDTHEVVDTSSDISNQKSSRKRGRPAKAKHGQEKKNAKNTFTEEAQQAGSKPQITGMENDEEDDVFLTNLSKATLTKQSIPEKLPPEEDCTDQQINSEKKTTKDLNEDDETDDISLSQLKETLETSTETEIIVDNEETEELGPVDVFERNQLLETPSKRNSIKPVMTDFEYNIDSITGETITNEDNKQIKTEEDLPDDSLLIEDSSKRPMRRKVRQTLHYDEGSDEDPFANVELSDDEPKSKRRGRKYNSDDEYVPGKKREKSSSSDSDIDVDLDDLLKQKRQKIPNKSSRKKKKQSDHADKLNSILDVTTIKPNDDIQQIDDIEVCLQSSVIRVNEDSSNKLGWGTTHEFESFIAQKIQGTDLKIKKVSSKEPSQSMLEIPVLDPEAKKTFEMCTQTCISTTTTGVQTTTPYEVPMKNNIVLLPAQSEKACEFLKNIVQTTSELGQLMTQKSEDFIAKKINIENVTDTFKMDYCVRKSFLLFKLAKHNLAQMEEDLSKQYEEFLKSNDLLTHREQQQVIAPTPKSADNDSDCEIVEGPVQNKKVPEKPKFNPKTVFLNKELSIKIAKKPTAATPEKPNKEQINIKGRHTVWISDSVMVKKVKPTQSFLAQDSRNKKPPDCYVTEKMVSDFFKDYYHKQAVSICAPYTSLKWFAIGKNYICSYFFVKPDKFSETDTSLNRDDNIYINSTQNNTAISVVNNDATPMTKASKISSPETLLSLCTKALQIYSYASSSDLVEENCVVYNKIADVKKNQTPETLSRLCVNSLNLFLIDNSSRVNDVCPTLMEVPALKTLCYRQIIEFPVAVSNMMHENIDASNLESQKSSKTCLSNWGNKVSCYFNDMFKEINDLTSSNRFCGDKNDVKSLLSLCVEFIQSQQKAIDTRDFNIIEDSFHEETLYTPNSLKHITSENVRYFLYRNSYPRDYYKKKDNAASLNTNTVHKVKKLADISFEMISSIFSESIINVDHEFTINSINTMTDEAFHNIEGLSTSVYERSQYVEDEETSFYDEDDFDAGSNNIEEDNRSEDNNWVSQVQMKELKSCFIPNRLNNGGKQIQTGEDNVYNEQPDTGGKQIQADEDNINNEQPIAQIKIEPLEEVLENFVDSSVVKTEPVHSLDEMTVIPDSVITKQESLEYLSSAKDPMQVNCNYEVEKFEAFVRSNKMMHPLDENLDPGDEIFSQSGLRVRRQYEPDSDDENIGNDSTMSLLIPQAFEPLFLESAKDCLMESSSDGESSGKKTAGKKKPEKRGRGRPKKSDTKGSNKEVVATKEKSQPPPNEVAQLTRKMRDRIRHEEKKIASSDSETENLPLNIRRDKDQTDNSKQMSSSSSNNRKDDEIQCNNVDSTELIDIEKPRKIVEFTGFTALDQNEISSYQKYVKYVYDKILPKVTAESENNATSNVDENNATSNVDENNATLNFEENKDTSNVNENYDRSNSPLINYDDPVELLECEPTMPIFDDFVQDPKQVKKSPANKTKTRKNKTNIQEKGTETPKKQELTCTDRHGWKCYPINKNDTKLYENATIFLEKLPESFVETYFRYQEVTDRDKEDEEVDRLVNLQSLNRSSNVKDGKIKIKPKGKTALGDQAVEQTSDVSRPATPANTDHYDELTPSEDEGANVDDEIPPLVPVRSTENNLAKNLLMNDNDSDSDAPTTKIKEEIKESPESNKDGKKRSKGHKSKMKVEEVSHPESLMLTADKMMNKELNLLHAPIVLNDGPGISAVGPATRNKNKSGTKSHSTRDRLSKNDDDSSSEEEKQWVSTKEKLLKRMGKNKDSTSLDDAKRAKLVSEFIERRCDAPDARKRGQLRGRRRSSKKRLEREKQLRVLSAELFGEGSMDAMHKGKKFSQSYFKGRRNIRKVIDKKSLARSTVIANMEEFERKCRLNQRQSRLRELLGCEEGVNVLVINDEVCLEYDFEEDAPVVTVHPFFTKVMKAHQYEGVKFMWDACFESLEKVESGHPGGGCILAHCMGLGKTLQVLALLHTVLTHPRVGMQRVLVCCPLSTVLNWVDEIHKWIGPVTDQIKVFELSKLKKTYERAYQLEDWYNGGGIFIIGYELFRSLSTLDPVLDDIRPTIVNKIRNALIDPGPDIVVCDEGHLLKNDCSVLAVAMSRVVTKRRIVLTGTPMQNNLREYYCMVNFIKPNLLGTYSEYSNRFENPIMNGQHRDSQQEDIKLMKQRTHILHKVLEGCLQRQEASVLYPYLPKKHEYTVFISLTKCQWDLYKHYMKIYAKQSKQSILKDFHILQKIWSHPQVLHNFQMRTRDESGNKIKPEKLEDDLAHEDLAATEDMKPIDTEVWWLQYLDGGNMLDALESSNKFVVVFRILDECIALGDKVLIFSTSLITMDALEYFLKHINKWSLGQEYFRLDGSVPPEVRQKWCREFNAENNVKTKLFLISTRAGSLGLNMVAANRVIILDTSWNPAHDIQSIFRVYRFGQKKDCYIYRLVAMGTMEQKIYERSVTKQAIACRVVDEQQIDRHYNMAELTELYKHDEMGNGVASGVAVGVTDVALLRVARYAALHAVHEHDSLLRGSSEHALPEHERAAAWMQFQQEHAHKQIQNQLTSSFSLHIPMKKGLHEGQSTGPPGLTTTETITKDTEYLPLSESKLKKSDSMLKKLESKLKKSDSKLKKSDSKLKKGKNSCVNNNLIPPIKIEKEVTKATLLVEDEMVKKIMDILIQHNFQNRQGPKEISELVSEVRKIVAFGKVPRGSFDSELTKSIANVLLGKEPTMPALTDIDTANNKRPRGRPRKTPVTEAAVPTTSTNTVNSYVSDGRRKRKAAIDAERHLEDALQSNPVIEVDDDDWQAANNDTDSAPEEITPEPKKQSSKTPKLRIKKEKIKENVSAQINMELNSITLSDDDEPVQPEKETKKTEKPAENKTVEDEDIPLHPSLLSNKNFIKIVAHTYLEGNPMLDEDAATLAANYSTHKALKEVEDTGKQITSGPIYDIAIKVLGKDILKKLQNSNVKLKNVGETASTTLADPKSVKLEETSEPKTTPAVRPMFKAKGIMELTGKPAGLVKVASKPTGPVLASSPSVVPVGLFKRAANITPKQQQQLTTKEESILPDDDDVHIISDPTPATSTPPLAATTLPKAGFIRRNAKPLILNAVIANTSMPPLTQSNPKVPTIKISGGKVVLQNSNASGTAPSNDSVVDVQASIQTPVVPETVVAGQNATICLDSDEEESITPNIQPITKTRAGSKRIALKSTAKPVVPVSLTAANTMINQPSNQFVTQPVQGHPVSLDQVSSWPTNKNYVVIPASQLNQLSNKLTKIPKAAVPTHIRMAQPVGEQNVVPQNINLMNQMSSAHPNMYPLNSIPQNIYSANNVPQNIYPVNSMPQNIYPASSVPQHLYTANSLPQNIYTSNSTSQLMYSTITPQMNMVPQNINLMNSLPQNMNQMNTVPQNINQMNTVPQNINPMNSVPENINQINIVPQNRNQVQQNAAPESILPTNTTNPAKKTVCKPGDILRITKTGQVEIINREDENDVEEVADTSNDKTKNSKEAAKKQSHAVASDVTPRDDDDLSTNPLSSRKSSRKSKTQWEHLRRISSSSSSSSDSSRPNSPDEDPDDPLAILKDVVHIRAADEVVETSKPRASETKAPSKQTKSSYVTNTKPSSSGTNYNTSKASASRNATPSSSRRSTLQSSNANRSVSHEKVKVYNATGQTAISSTSKASASKTTMPTSSKSTTTYKSSTTTLNKDKMTKQIDQSSDVLKKLNNLLGPSPVEKKRTLQLNKTSCLNTSSVTKTKDLANSLSRYVDSVDLTDFDSPKVLNKLSKDIVVGKTDTKSSSSGRTSRTSLDKKDAPQKLVGTSKNIIISGTGKASTLSTTDASCKKAIRVMNVEKIAPPTSSHKPWSDVKKRAASAAETNPPKKKKTEPLTLKDFDIDDIDDIIELE